MDRMEEADFPLAYGEALLEQGVWAHGHKLMTCGGMSGHSVEAIAFCKNKAVAEAIANALKTKAQDKAA